MHAPNTGHCFDAVSATVSFTQMWDFLATRDFPADKDENENEVVIARELSSSGFTTINKNRVAIDQH